MHGRGRHMSQQSGPDGRTDGVGIVLSSALVLCLLVVLTHWRARAADRHLPRLSSPSGPVVAPGSLEVDDPRVAHVLRMHGFDAVHAGVLAAYSASCGNVLRRIAPGDHLRALFSGTVDDRYVVGARRYAERLEVEQVDVAALVERYEAARRGLESAVPDPRFHDAVSRALGADLALACSAILAGQRRSVHRLQAASRVEEEAAQTFHVALAHALARMADGALDARVEGRFAGDRLEIVRAFEGAAGALNRSLVKVDGAVHEVVAASRQIEAGSRAVASASASASVALDALDATIASAGEVAEPLREVVEMAVVEIRNAARRGATTSEQATRAAEALHAQAAALATLIRDFELEGLAPEDSFVARRSPHFANLRSEG